MNSIATGYLASILLPIGWILLRYTMYENFGVEAGDLKSLSLIFVGNVLLAVYGIVRNDLPLVILGSGMGLFIATESGLLMKIGQV